MSDKTRLNSIEEAKPFWQAIVNWWSMRNSKTIDIMPAKEAYSRITYGSKVSKDDLVLTHQYKINRRIKDRTQTPINSGDEYNIDYACLYSFPEDVVGMIDVILQPFIEKGYTVVNLSEIVPVFRGRNVYAISCYQENL